MSVAAFLSGRKKLLGHVLIALALIIIYCLDLFSYAEYRLEDMVYQRPASVENPNIFVFGIDEKSLSEIDGFQRWSRTVMADAVNILNRDEEFKPAVIAIDILYIEESDDKAADEALAEAAAKGGNVVVVSHAVFGDDRENLSLETVVIKHETPYPSLARSAPYGLSNATVDKDGVIRRALLKTAYNGETLPSFPYVIYNKLNGGLAEELAGAGDEVYITYSQEPGGYYGISGAGLSFSDIFAEDFEPEYFADSVVFIGPYASGLLDSYYTPVSHETQMYGVEIHANVLQMLMEGNIKTRVSPGANLLIVLLSVVIGTFLSLKTDIRVFLAATAALCIGYVCLALWLFNGGYVVMLLYPVFSLIVIYLYQLGYGYVSETIEKQKVKSAFKKYVDPKLVDRIIETGEANSNEVGVKKNIAVLFVDIRGFTPMSETLGDRPELVVKILNEYLELTSSSVFNNGGSVDKFVGDATMALFNGFVPLDDYVFKAVKAAWDIVQGASGVNESIKEKYNVDVGFGVGVNCGEAIVGNLGPSFRKDYTAIGDTVNTAARLEANAKSSEILISDKVYNIVKDRVEAISVGEIPLKGKSAKMEVYSVKNIRSGS